MTAISADCIKGFVARIERLDGEQQTVGLDKRGVFDEAKKAGVNTKMLRRLLSERKRDAKDSTTDKDTLDEYRGLLGEPGATYRSVAAKLGMTKSRLNRLVPKKQTGTSQLTVISPPEVESLPAHDPTTGEIKDETAEAKEPPNGPGAASAKARSADAGDGTRPTVADDGGNRPPARPLAQTAERTVSVGAAASEPTPVHIDLTIPSFLRRVG